MQDALLPDGQPASRRDSSASVRDSLDASPSSVAVTRARAHVRAGLLAHANQLQAGENAVPPQRVNPAALKEAREAAYAARHAVLQALVARGGTNAVVEADRRAQKDREAAEAAAAAAAEREAQLAVARGAAAQLGGWKPLKSWGNLCSSASLPMTQEEAPMHRDIS